MSLVASCFRRGRAVCPVPDLRVDPLYGFTADGSMSAQITTMNDSFIVQKTYANGATSSAVTAGSIRVSLRGGGLSGKELTAAVNKALRQQTPAASAVVSGFIAGGAMLKGVRETVLKDGRVRLAVTLEEPKEDAFTKVSAERDALSKELADIRAQIEAGTESPADKRKAKAGEMQAVTA